VVRRQDLIRRQIERLCERVAEFAATGQAMDLGAAISAFQRDVSTEFILGKSYDSLNQPDFGVGMTRVMHGGGTIWRLTKHIRWYGPAMLSIPRDFLIKNADRDTANFMRYAKASSTIRRQLGVLRNEESFKLLLITSIFKTAPFRLATTRPHDS
jgi:hypothetical protein